MDRGAWRAAIHEGHKESDPTRQLTLSHSQHRHVPPHGSVKDRV